MLKNLLKKVLKSYFFEPFFEYFFEQISVEYFFEHFFEYFFELIFEAKMLMKPTSEKKQKQGVPPEIKDAVTSPTDKSKAGEKMESTEVSAVDNK